MVPHNCETMGYAHNVAKMSLRGKENRPKRSTFLISRRILQRRFNRCRLQAYYLETAAFMDNVSEMTDSEIKELIANSTTGDHASFEKLVRHFESFVFGLALRLLGEETDARDVAQEAFVRVWRHLRRYDANRKFTAWLSTIVVNLSRDRLRARNRESRRFVSRESESAMNDALARTNSGSSDSETEIAALVTALTKRLPATQRVVFTLRDLEDMTVAEVAEITGLTAGSVKTNLHYARAKIRELLYRLYQIEGR